MNYQQFLDEASKHLRSTPARVEKIITTAPFRYKFYTIPKRTGGRRQIFHPSPALKSMQRWMVSGPISGLPVHDSVFSYVQGKNIGMNAAEHIFSNYFIRFDFADFFPSITGRVLRDFLRRSVAAGLVDVDDVVIAAVVRLACRAVDEKGLALTIGAPSSPYLSNAVLNEFDEAVSEVAIAADVVYTRYADDIYVSSRSLAELGEFEERFRGLVAERLPFLRINEDKVQHLSRKRRVTVTGVNITSDRKLSVGRDRKRRIRTLLYLAKSGLLEGENFSSLRGDIAYVWSIEPDFIERLEKKFGGQFVQEFMAGHVAI